MFGGVSGDSVDATGLHDVSWDLLKSGIIDPTRPQIVIYEPTKRGQLKLIGADFLVLSISGTRIRSTPLRWNLWDG